MAEINGILKEMDRQFMPLSVNASFLSFTKIGIQETTKLMKETNKHGKGKIQHKNTGTRVLKPNNNKKKCKKNSFQIYDGYAKCLYPT